MVFQDRWSLTTVDSQQGGLSNVLNQSVYKLSINMYVSNIANTTLSTYLIGVIL